MIYYGYQRDPNFRPIQTNQNMHSSSPHSFPERRWADRLDLAGLHVEVQIMGPDSLNIMPARDISAAGIGVHAPAMFHGCEMDSEVELVITLPGKSSFLAKGIIRHRTKGSDQNEYFGIEFTRIYKKHRAQIQDFIKNVKAQAERQIAR